MNRFLKSRRMVVVSSSIVIIISCISVALLIRPIDAKTVEVHPDWSRGIAVGATNWNQPPAVAASSNGQAIHLAWGDNPSNNVGVHYLQFNDRAERVIDQRLSNLEGTPQSIQIVLDGQERPHIFVLARLPGDSVTRVLLWSPNSNAGAHATPISPANVDVQSCAVVARQDVFEVFFTGEPDSDDPGVYFARVNADDTIVTQAQLNAHPARDVSATVDRNRTIHLVWSEMQSAKTRRVFYQTFPAMPQPAEGKLIGEEMPAAAKIALDDERVYVLWGQALRGSAQAGGGTGYINLSTFPIDQAQRLQPANVDLPSIAQIAFTPYRGDYRLTLTTSAKPVSGIRPAELLYAPMPVATRGKELTVMAIAGLGFSSATDLLGRPPAPPVIEADDSIPASRLMRILERGTQVRVVPVMLFLRDGAVVDYQVIGYSNGISFSPNGAADRNGNLYASWLVGSSWQGYHVYYASTAPGAHAQFDTVDLTDMLLGTTGTLWKMLAGFALLPFFPFLVAPAMLIAVIYTVLGSHSELMHDPKSYRILVLACLAYWSIKQVVLGAVLSDPIIVQALEGASHSIAVWSIQVAIALIAAAITWRQIARQRIHSALWAILLFCGVDMLLSMLMAGPTLAMTG